MVESIGNYRLDPAGLDHALYLKLKHLAMVKTCLDCLDLFNDLGSDAQLDEQVSLEENETRLEQLQDLVWDLEDVDITTDPLWANDMGDHSLENDDQEYDSDAESEDIISDRKALVTGRMWEYEDEIRGLDDDNIDLRCRLEYIEMDAVSSVAYLACGVDFTPLYN